MLSSASGSSVHDCPVTSGITPCVDSSYWLYLSPGLGSFLTVLLLPAPPLVLPGPHTEHPQVQTDSEKGLSQWFPSMPSYRCHKRIMSHGYGSCHVLSLNTNSAAWEGRHTSVAWFCVSKLWLASSLCFTIGSGLAVVLCHMLYIVNAGFFSFF